MRPLLSRTWRFASDYVYGSAVVSGKRWRQHNDGEKKNRTGGLATNKSPEIRDSRLSRVTNFATNFVILGCRKGLVAASMRGRGMDIGVPNSVRHQIAEFLFRRNKLRRSFSGSDGRQYTLMNQSFRSLHLSSFYSSCFPSARPRN